VSVPDSPRAMSIAASLGPGVGNLVCLGDAHRSGASPMDRLRNLWFATAEIAVAMAFIVTIAAIAKYGL
jgi:hypothetical protein